MKTSREQFDEWFSAQNERMMSCGLGMIHIRRAHDAAWAAWQASRQCIEVGGSYCVKIKLQNGGEASIRDVTKIEIVEYKGA